MMRGQVDSEEKLSWLTRVHLPENRNRWALEYKGRGKNVLGLLEGNVPEEILHAGGILSYRVIGTWQADTPRAHLWRPVDVCRYCNHVLESIMAGELDFLDGIVFTDWDDDEKRLYDVCLHINKPSHNYIVHMPRMKKELHFQYYTKLLRELIRWLEETFGVKITDDSLWQAVELYDKMRSLLMQLYGWRKREVPPVSGTEAVGIVLASFFMPKEEYVKDLESLMGYLENRQIPLKQTRPRLLVSSDRLDHLGYLKLIEDEGALVAMDDLDTGSRYFWVTVDSGSDPVYALAKRYITRLADPGMFFWDEQVEQVIHWVKEYDIRGVLHMPYMGCYDRLCCNSYFLRRLNEVGIPIMTFLREYHLANVGQLRTRVSAFMETL
jgi:benzoyl-CoA reductase subunit C